MWKKLESELEIESILKESVSKPVIIFKHSTRCGISNMVLKRFEKIAGQYQQQFTYYYLDLLAYRTISNTIANHFDVEHQSPQILVIKNKNCVFNASHYDILDTNFERFL